MSERDEASASEDQSETDVEDEFSEEKRLTDSTPGRRTLGQWFLSTVKRGGVSVGSRSPRNPVSVSDEYRVYPWRWFMLATLCLLNMSNSMLWLTFAPIPNYTAVLYGVTLGQADWFSICYLLVSLPVGFVAIAILDIFGLRTALYIGAGFNLAGAVLRWVSIAPSIVCFPHYELSGYVVAMLGQILSACAQPFFLYAPTKLASFWFGPKERAFCTMLASMGNLVGLAMAQLISPHVVSSLDSFSTLHLIYTAPAAVGGVCAAVAYWKNRPPVPPAPSAHRDPTPFLVGLKRTLTSPSFLLLLVIWGFSSGLFNSMLILLPQMLCPFGYSEQASGLWGALMIFSGLAGATCAGLIIDYFKLYKEVAVVSFSLAMLCLIWFVEVFSLTGQGVNIAFSLCLFGFFALPLIPAVMELGVEVTYPVSEATSSGLLWSMTQIMGMVLLLVGQALQQEAVVTQDSKCGVGQVSNSTTLHCRLHHNTSAPEQESLAMDFTYTLLLYLVVGVLSLLTMATLFRPQYKRLEMERLEMERSAVLLSKLQEATPSSSVTSLFNADSEGQSQGQSGPFKMTASPREIHQRSTEL